MPQIEQSSGRTGASLYPVVASTPQPLWQRAPPMLSGFDGCGGKQGSDEMIAANEDEKENQTHDLSTRPYSVNTCWGCRFNGPFDGMGNEADSKEERALWDLGKLKSANTATDTSTFHATSESRSASSYSLSSNVRLSPQGESKQPFELEPSTCTVGTVDRVLRLSRRLNAPSPTVDHPSGPATPSLSSSSLSNSALLCPSPRHGSELCARPNIDLSAATVTQTPPSHPPPPLSLSTRPATSSTQTTQPQRIHDSILHLLRQIINRKKATRSEPLFEWRVARLEKLSLLISDHIKPEDEEAHTGIPWDHLKALSKWLIQDDNQMWTYVGGIRTTVRLSALSGDREFHEAFLDHIIQQDVPELLESLERINSNDWFVQKRWITMYTRRLVDFHRDEPQLHVIDTSINALLMVDELSNNSYAGTLSPYYVLRHVAALGEAMYQLSPIVYSQGFDSPESDLVIRLRHWLDHPERKPIKDRYAELVRRLRQTAQRQSITARDMMGMLQQPDYLGVGFPTWAARMADTVRTTLCSVYSYEVTHEDTSVDMLHSPPIHGEHWSEGYSNRTVHHRTRWIRRQHTKDDTSEAFAALPLDKEVPRGWMFWSGLDTICVKRLIKTDDGTYKQRTTTTTATTRLTSQILNSCGEYEAKRVSRLVTAQRQNKFDEVLEMIQVYCQTDTSFKLDGRLKNHLRGNPRSARTFVNMARLLDTVKRVPSIVTFLKELENKEARRKIAAPSGGVSSRRPATTNSTVTALLDEAARQVDCMMQYSTSAEEAVNLHNHMTQHINRIHADDIVLGSAHRANARMIIEPVREWWMVMAGSMATAVLNNSALHTLDLIPTEAREVLEHLVKAVRNLLAHNRISHPTTSIPTSDNVATLVDLPKRCLGLALTPAKPSETYQRDLYKDIAYHNIIRETNCKLRAAKLSAVIQRARSSMSLPAAADPTSVA